MLSDMKMSRKHPQPYRYPGGHRRKLFAYMCMLLHILAAGIIQGQCLFHLELLIVRLPFQGSDYLRAAAIQRNIVLTSLTPFSIILLAIGACPCPRERVWNRSAIPSCSASCNRAEVGSLVRKRGSARERERWGGREQREKEEGSRREGGEVGGGGWVWMGRKQKGAGR